MAVKHRTLGGKRYDEAVVLIYRLTLFTVGNPWPLTLQQCYSTLEHMNKLTVAWT